MWPDSAMQMGFVGHADRLDSKSMTILAPETEARMAHQEIAGFEMW